MTTTLPFLATTRSIRELPPPRLCCTALASALASAQHSHTETLPTHLPGPALVLRKVSVRVHHAPARHVWWCT